MNGKKVQLAIELYNKPSNYISPSQAAEYLGVHINTIYNYIKTDILTAYRFKDGGNTIFIDKNEIIRKLVPIPSEEIRKTLTGVYPVKKVLYG